MKSGIYAICCAILGILVIVILYALSPKVNQQGNGFNRLFIQSYVSDKVQSFDLRSNAYYIAGSTNKRIYLGNFTKPNDLLLIDHDLSDSQYINLSIPDNERLAWGALKMTVDSPNVFIVEGITPTIFQGILSSRKYKRSTPPNLHFSKSTPLDSDNFIVRTYDSTLNQNILKKAVINSPSSKEYSFTLEKQVDGFFCTDGMLLYNTSIGQVLYIYYYRNTVTSLNTNLDVLYTFNTIDTISQANIKVSKISSENKTVLTSNPVVVNKHSAVYKNWLFIHSGLLADNEQHEQFKKNSVIDVYSLDDQKYKFSFYIPLFNKMRMHDFLIYENNLIVLHDHYIVAYKLKTESLRDKPEIQTSINDLQ